VKKEAWVVISGLPALIPELKETWLQKKQGIHAETEM
jgi:hypothetical protein